MRFDKKNYLLFLCYLLTAFIVYYKSLAVYFLSDDLTQIRIMNDFGLAGITHNFDIAFIRPLPYIFMAVIHTLFGHTSAIPYHAWNIIIHTLNAFLVYKLYKVWVKYYSPETEKSEVFPMIAGLLFLVLPYQTEAVTWVAATVDLMVTTFILLTLIFFFNYKSENNRKKLYLSSFFFFLALMCKESCLFVPILIFGFSCVEYFPKQNYSKPFKIALLYLVWFPLYIFMRYYFLGELIGGYHEMHTSFKPLLIVYNAALYTAKFFAFYRILPNGIRDIFKIIIHHRIILVSIIVLLFAMVFYFRTQLKNKLLNKNTLLLIFAFYCSLIPVINLETSFIGDSQSDRYGYVPAVFFILLLTYLLFEFFNKKVVLVLSAVLFVWFFMNVQSINNNWLAGSTIAEPIIKNLDPGKETAYIFNLPDNFRGTYMLRTGLADGVSFIKEGNYTNKIKVVSWHPLQSAHDSISVMKVGDKIYQIDLLAEGERFYFADKIFVHNPNKDIYSILEHSNTHLLIEFKKLKFEDKLYYYTSGKLIELER